jgi:trimeric autotransporter adhesin
MTNGKKGAQRTYFSLFFILLLALTLSPIATFGGIPGTINYQGYLTDSGGTPVHATVSMIFSIYETDIGGVSSWTETQNVEVSNGIYTVQLGKNAPLTLHFDVPYYLGISVAGDPEMTPRKPLTAVPYAFRAKTTEIDQDTLAGLSCTGGQVARWDGTAWGCGEAGASYTAGTGLTLAGTEFRILGPYQLPQACSNGQVAKWNGSAWICAFDADTTYSPSSTVSAVDGSSSSGSSAEYSRGDHKHGISAGAIASTHILDGTVLFADIGQNGCSNGQIIKWNGTAWTCAADNAGSSPSATVSTLTGTGTTGTAAEHSRGDHAHAIGTGAITSAQILDGTITNSDISSTAAIDFSKLSGAASSAHNHDSAYVIRDQPSTITSAMIINGTVAPEDVGFNYAGSSSKGGPSTGLDCLGCVTAGNLASQSVATWNIDKGPAVAGDALMYDGTNVVWGNPTSTPITLPYSGTSSSSSTAFSITNTGGGGAGAFVVTDSLNAAEALVVETYGVGRAAYFGVFNDSNDYPALHVVRSGTGDAGRFEGNVTVTGTLQASSIAGFGSGLTSVDADKLDGQHATAFASATHQHSGGDITAGTVVDTRLSTNVVLLDNAQTLTGVKTFNPSSGTVPFAVNASKTDIVTNLNADRLDGKHASDFVGSGQAGSITTGMIVNGAILFEDIAQNGCGAGQVMKWNGTAWACAADESTNSWNLGGNSGTNPSTNFIGTTDNQALEIRVNNGRVLRVEPNAESPNIIGGYNGNAVTPGVKGAAITGGGANTLTNRVTDNYGTVGGGNNNRAGDDAGTTSDKIYATVAGGISNVAGGDRSSVGGGTTNVATGSRSTISGGYFNEASANSSTVGGGFMNVAGGAFAVVPGGSVNSAAGDYTLAAGRQAKANHQGAFVWADSTDADFASTANDEFRVRASGGVEFVVGSGSWRIEPNATSPNIVGGHTDNTVGSGVYGGTIAGGGYSLFGNRVSDNYCTVGGGADNYSGTTGNGQYATIGGGFGNRAYGPYSAIGGGSSNRATGTQAVVAGGGGNYATGDYAMVPGGTLNEAVGNYSFAAGRHAKASTVGTFVWADSSNFDFTAPTPNSFRVRATGGVRFVLGIDGSGNMDWWCYVADGSNAWSCTSDRNQKENLTPVDGKETLNVLNDLPIYKWNGKGHDPNVQHLGPMAQDFYAAFGLGDDDKVISTNDLTSIGLAAIQGLYQVVREKDARIKQLEEQNTAQQQAINDLEKRLAAIEIRLGLASTK